jgi:hypothetical protein
VILGLVVCCGLAALVFTLAGGAALWNQISDGSQIPPQGMVIQDTAAPTDTLMPPFNQVQATPAVQLP